MILGRGVNVPGTITNTQKRSNNKDDSITTIMDVMSTMQMASNVNT